MFRGDLLAGKRILITGGGSGLGREMAEQYLSLGACVHICGRRAQVLEQTAAELMQRHGGSSRLTCATSAMRRRWRKWWRRSGRTVL